MVLDVWFKASTRATAKWHAVEAGQPASLCGRDFAENARIIKRVDSENPLGEVGAGGVRDTGFYTRCQRCARKLA